MVLSSLAEIVGYIDSPPSNKWNEWMLLSAVQREIDMRYAVVPDRHLSGFMDIAGPKSQTVQDAVEYIQREMYELAPYFLNLDVNYNETKFQTFPTYYDKHYLNLDDEHSIEKLIVEGTIPTETRNGIPGGTKLYNDFLMHVCYWLGKFRYRNDCPYTFTLSTFDRRWEYTEEDGALSINQGDTSLSNSTWDVWEMASPNSPDLRRRQWEQNNNVSANNNGQESDGVQVEVFQWFRRKDLNNPRYGEEYNGYPASDNVVNSEGMPNGKEPPWTTIDPSELTAAWSQWNYEMDPGFVPTGQNHIPSDLSSDWTCKTRLSTVTRTWQTLENGWESSLSSVWAKQLSVGWDKVMTTEQKSLWGTHYLSNFPVTGLTGRILGIPTLSATPSKSEDFFPDTGHKMNYTLEIEHNSKIYEAWEPDPWTGEIKTRQSEYLHIVLDKKDMPFEVTMENPTAYDADGYVVFYPTHLPGEHDTKSVNEKDVIETKKFRQTGGGVPIWERDLLVEITTKQISQHSADYYTTATGAHVGINTPIYYDDRTESIRTSDWPEMEGSEKRTETGSETRWNLQETDSFLVRTWELSSGIHNMEFGYEGNTPYYPDTFGLYQADESSTSADSDEDEGTGGAMQFLPTEEISAYSYKTIWKHLSSDTPPIDFDIASIADKELQGPFYPLTYNDVLFHQTSEMRIYTFLDFSKSFNLDKELD